MASSADDAGTIEKAAPACFVLGKPHIGLGGEDLSAKTDGPVNADRTRTKPYSALVTEYTRVLGTKNKPALIDSTGGTFGQPNDRWYIEPLASAVFVNTAYNVAFEGCLKLTGDIAGGSAEPRYAAEPSADSARVECVGWTRRFWSREATPDQLDACVSIALESTTETYAGPSGVPTTRDTPLRRRWAYACASVLTATGFLMY